MLHLMFSFDLVCFRFDPDIRGVFFACAARFGIPARPPRWARPPSPPAPAGPPAPPAPPSDPEAAVDAVADNMPPPAASSTMSEASFVSVELHAVNEVDQAVERCLQAAEEERLRQESEAHQRDIVAARMELEKIRRETELARHRHAAAAAMEAEGIKSRAYLADLPVSFS